MHARDTARPTPAREAARPSRSPRGEPPLLALQQSAGNAAVVQMLRRGAGGGQAEGAQRSAVDRVLRGAGRSLDEETRADMESRLGADFSDVRVHTGSVAESSAAELGARAYTVGNHVVIGAGGGDRHTLAHELTHVVQQRRGPVAGTDHGGGLRVSDPSDRFEREAEATATRVLAGPAPAATLQRREGDEHDHGHDHDHGHGHGHHDTVQRVWQPKTGNEIIDIIVGGGNDTDSPRRVLAGFEFGPECRNNGGNNLISRPIPVSVPREGGGTAQVAVHLNVVLELGNETGTEAASSVKIKGKNFHLTARPLQGQNLIDAAGASILTARDSIHVGPRNAAAGWNNRTDNTQNLADAIGATVPSVVPALEHRFPPGDTVELAHQFQKDAGRAVLYGLKPTVVTVNWEGDASFPA